MKFKTLFPVTCVVGICLASTVVFAGQTTTTAVLDTNAIRLIQHPVNINSASETELQQIPGITLAFAKKIITGRPYISVSQLYTKQIIPRAVYSTTAGMMRVYK